MNGSKSTRLLPKCIPAIVIPANARIAVCVLLYDIMITSISSCYYTLLLAHRLLGLDTHDIMQYYDS